MKTTGRPLPKIQVTKPSGKTAAVNANWYAKYSGTLVQLLTIGYTAGPVCSWVNHTHGL